MLDALLAELMTEPVTPVWHRSVLVEEVVHYLAPSAGEIIADCTAGTGGHSLAILPHVMPTGRVLAIDCDGQALVRAQQRLTEFEPHVQCVRGNFRHLPDLLKQGKVTKVDGLIADLGLSSLHVDQPERGFSFSHEDPLDMRMDRQATATAASLIQQLPEPDLIFLLERYGEERWARRIAKRIVTVRKRQPIRTTTQLARVVAEAVPKGHAKRRLHPATRTFLALRIAVNEELVALEALLKVLPTVLAPGGRAVIITFHSLEDRLVKQAFRQGAQQGYFQVLTKKPVRPSPRELAENPRSRSAKLRAVERLS